MRTGVRSASSARSPRRPMWCASPEVRSMRPKQSEPSTALSAASSPERSATRMSRSRRACMGVWPWARASSTAVSVLPRSRSTRAYRSSMNSCSRRISWSVKSACAPVRDPVCDPVFDNSAPGRIGWRHQYFRDLRLVKSRTIEYTQRNPPGAIARGISCAACTPVRHPPLRHLTARPRPRVPRAVGAPASPPPWSAPARRRGRP